jgi:hypothetical protein
MPDHAFNTRTEAADSTPAVSFFAGSSTASLLGPFRIQRAEAISERRRTASTVINVLHRNGFDEAKSGRCDRVIRAAGSNRSRQLRGVFSVGKFVQDPRPIVFGMGELAGMLSRWDCMGQRRGSCRRNIQPKVTWIRSRIARVFDGDGMRRIVLAIPESRQAEDRVTVRAGGISAKGNRKQFEGAFLLLESETVNAAEDLIFAERCREDCGRRGNCIGGPERSEAGLSVDIET